MATPERSRLAELAAELGKQHAACEAALSSAVEHAIRAGKLLVEAKDLLAHGEWLPWLAEHFAGSERSARGYMQLAREADRRPVADLGVRAALAAIAAPRGDDAPEAPAEEGEEAEVVDAEPVPEPPSIFDMLRDAVDFEAIEEEVREEEERRDRERFPRNGVERKTMRQIRDAATTAQRYLELTRGPDKSDWTCAEALAGAGREFTEAGELASELSGMIHKRVRDPNR